MANRFESNEIKIDQALFKQLYDRAILKIPDTLRRQGLKKNNPKYNAILKTSIELFLSKNNLIKNILEPPSGDAKSLFDNIFRHLRVSEEDHPKAHAAQNPVKDRQPNLPDLI